MNNLRATQNDPKLWLRTFAKRRGVLIQDDQLIRLEKYADLLKEWNQKINLISRKDEENIWESHILHCLTPLFLVAIRPGSRVLDLGTGGGLPGIPWKILNDTLEFTLVDATKKKILAVEQMIGQLGLAGVKAVWGRAEVLNADPAYRGRFDLVVARGVAPLQDLVRLAVPFLTEAAHAGDREGTKEVLATPCLLAFKGGDTSEEFRKAGRNTNVKGIVEMPLPGNGEEGLWVDKKITIVHF